MSPHIAVLIPCRNEAVAVPRVIAAFRAALPNAAIHVYDNTSTDDTVAVARAAGAAVGYEPRQGKGHVVRRMFADVEADIYVLVDGDDTYDAAAAPAMITLLRERRLDMVTAVRTGGDRAAYRRGHRTGNSLLTWLVGALFGLPVGDMLSGYRVFSRRFVKTFPALSGGFETETELTVHALQLALPTGEVSAAYSERPAGSASKLRTVSDGLRILRLILMLVKDEDQPCLDGSVFLKRIVPQAALVVVPRAGHTITLEEPAAVNSALLELFSAVSLDSWMAHRPRIRAGVTLRNTAVEF